MVRSSCSLRIIEQAKAAGATVAGVADTTLLREAGAYQHSSAPSWPQQARSVLVIGLAHPEAEPELDWWGGQGGTPGNQQLIGLAERLRSELTERLKLTVQPLPYHVTRGGIFLKEAAVLAGLGVIGDNNLLVTPQLGPRVRLRALFIDLEVTAELGEPTGAAAFVPCRDCDRPCQSACPQRVFVDGRYDGRRCSAQMRLDESRPRAGTSSPAVATGYRIAYCRACELACPVGATG